MANRGVGAVDDRRHGHDGAVGVQHHGEDQRVLDDGHVPPQLLVVLAVELRPTTAAIHLRPAHSCLRTEKSQGHPQHTESTDLSTCPLAATRSRKGRWQRSGDG